MSSTCEANFLSDIHLASRQECSSSSPEKRSQDGLQQGSGITACGLSTNSLSSPDVQDGRHLHHGSTSSANRLSKCGIDKDASDVRPPTDKQCLDHSPRKQQWLPDLGQACSDLGQSCCFVDKRRIEKLPLPKTRQNFMPVAVSMPTYKDCSLFSSADLQNTKLTCLVKDVADHYSVQTCVLTLQCSGTFNFQASHGLVATASPPCMRNCFQFFCHNISRNLPTIIYNVAEHSLAKDDALVTGEQGARFYVCAPLIYGPGVYLGTLCILDNKPRKPFSLKDCRFLEEKAAQVVNIFMEHQMVAT